VITHVIESAICVAIIVGCLAVMVREACDTRNAISEDEPVPYEVVPPCDMFGEPIADWERDILAERLRQALASENDEVALLNTLWDLPSRVKQ
jgi:hypothetical protein